MKRILIAILTALTLLAGWTPAAHAADRTPLLMEGPIMPVTACAC